MRVVWQDTNPKVKQPKNETSTKKEKALSK